MRCAGGRRCGRPRPLILPAVPVWPGVVAKLVPIRPRPRLISRPVRTGSRPTPRSCRTARGPASGHAPFVDVPPGELAGEGERLTDLACVHAVVQGDGDECQSEPVSHQLELVDGVTDALADVSGGARDEDLHRLPVPHCDDPALVAGDVLGEDVPESARCIVSCRHGLGELGARRGSATGPRPPDRRRPTAWSSAVVLGRRCRSVSGSGTRGRREEPDVIASDLRVKRHRQPPASHYRYGPNYRYGHKLGAEPPPDRRGPRSDNSNRHAGRRDSDCRP